MTYRDISLALMAGIDIPIPDLQLIVHSPSVKDIAYMGEEKFFQAMQYLCIDKEALTQDETVLQNLDNFQVLMRVLEESSDKEKKIAVQTLLMMLFPNYKVVMMPRSITLIGDGQPPIMIDSGNFDVFQDVIKQVLCANNLFQGKNVVYNPEGDRAKDIANKLIRGRKKVAAQKAASEGDTSILTRYISILRTGPHIPIQESIGYNLFQLFDQIERYSAYIEWDIDLQVRLAGGKPDKQVETWMRNLYNVK